MLFQTLLPDVFLDDIYLLTPEFFKEKGVSALILDIDNTLVTYDDPEPTPPVLNWLNAMKENGIKMAFVSNNEPERVERFNRSLGFFGSGKSGKPGTGKLREAMRHMQVTPGQTAVIGDQLFTDIAAGRRAGTYAVLVKPIKDKTTLFFKAKRLLERPFLSLYRRRERKKNT